MLLVGAALCEPLTYIIREGNGTPLQYSCLENPMDRGAWGVQSMGLQQSRTQLSNQTARTIATYKLLDFDNVNYEPHFSCLNFNASIMEHL